MILFLLAVRLEGPYRSLKVTMSVWKVGEEDVVKQKIFQEYFDLSDK